MAERTVDQHCREAGFKTLACMILGRDLSLCAAEAFKAVATLLGCAFILAGVTGNYIESKIHLVPCTCTWVDPDREHSLSFNQTSLCLNFNLTFCNTHTHTHFNLFVFIRVPNFNDTCILKLFSMHRKPLRMVSGIADYILSMLSESSSEQGNSTKTRKNNGGIKALLNLRILLKPW